MKTICYFWYILNSNLTFWQDFALILFHFVWKLCFLSVSTQNHAESFRNLIKKTVFDHLFFCVTHVSQKSFFWHPDGVFQWKSRVLQVSGRNTFENTYKITSRSKFSTQIVQIPYNLHPALSNSLYFVGPGPIFKQTGFYYIGLLLYWTF